MALLWFLLLIGVLTTVHECGHLVAARLCGVGVLKISIGFGRPVLAVRRRGTEYAIGRFPLGGYVRLLGEDRRDPISDADRRFAFTEKPPWQRLVVIFAGPAANLVFALCLFAHVYAGQTTAPSSTIGAVFAGQPAAEAGLRAGDRVIAIDDQPIRYWDELNRTVLASPGKELRITVERGPERGAVLAGQPGGDHPITKYVRPREHLRTDPFGERERVGLIGIAPHYRLPQVGVLSTQSAAYRAGMRSFDVVLSIQGRTAQTPADLEPLVRPQHGGMLIVSYVRPAGAELAFAAVERLSPRTAQVIPTAIERPGRPPRYDAGVRPADLFVRQIEVGTPAAGLGLKTGDVLSRLDEMPLSSWELFAQTLEERPLEAHRLEWLTPTEGEPVERRGTFQLTPKHEIDEYQAESTYYVFGADGARAISQVEEVPVEQRLPQAVARAVTQSVGAAATLLRVLGLTLAGKMPATAIGGPILLYQVAGVAAKKGFDQFLLMAALVSINLGLLNLFPLPLLDGGQASLVLVETVWRRPLPHRFVERAAAVGLALIVALLIYASRNDVLRHLR
jgi:regulator of sigma E protease